MGATRTLYSSRVTNSGNTPLGIKSVMFTCETGSETINGIQRLAGQVLSIESHEDSINEISYDAKGGAIQIDYLA